MTLYEFNAFNEDQKAEVVWSGVLIADRTMGGSKFLLYQLPNFYVELTYDPVENRIEKFKSFTSIEPLEVYLGQINIKDLLS